MAINYQTGTVNGSQDLFNHLDIWLLAHGWTAVDAITTGDKVYSSSGTSGKEQMFVRVTRNEDSGNPWKFGFNKWRSGLQIRGYQTWNAGTHTGTGRYGKWGPVYMAGNSGSTWRAFKINEDATKYPATATAELTSCPLGFAGRVWEFDGRRRLITYDTPSTFRIIDAAGEVAQSWATAGAPESVSSSALVQPAYVVDANGGEHLYILSLASSTFWRYDFDTNTWTSLGPSIFAAVAGDGAATIWDGNDTLYSMRGAGSTNWAKYSISGGTWTTLAAMPVVRQNSNPSMTGPWYIPASVTGLSNDIILTGTTSGQTVLHRYNVGLDTWGSHITLTPLDASFDTSWSGGFDNQRYIHLFRLAANSQSRGIVIDLQTQTASSMGVPLFSSSLTMVSGDTVVAPTAAVYLTSATATYHFLGDGDAFFIGVTENSGKNHWAYYGRYDSFASGSVATLTSSVSAGLLVSIPVDSSSSITAGTLVSIVSTDGTNAEQVTVYDVPDSTHFRANLVKSHSNGARVGHPHDVLPYVCTGSSLFASIPLDSTGQYNSDFINQSYYLRPLMPANALLAGAPTPIGTYQPCPWAICNYDLPVPNQFANVGLLRLVTCMMRTATPTTGDTITIKGKLYKVMTQDANFPSTYPQGVNVVFGPIN